jgi:diguanylate cyclase (GGDEF)-like protein/PAS domain S-box-containing protein
MRRSARTYARLAGFGAAVSAGAAAVSIARCGRHAPASSAGADAGLVGLIERVAEATSRVETVDDVLMSCVEQLCRWTGWPVGHVYFGDGADPSQLLPSRLWYLADRTRFERFREQTERTTFPRGVGLPGRVLESGRAEWIVDVTCDANFPRHKGAASVGLRGGFSFPIPIAGATFAVIECYSVQAVSPDDRLLEVAAHVGRQVGRRIDGMRMEQALRESESRFRSVAESANDAIIAADSAGRLLSCNPAAERMFGFEREDVIGRPLSFLMPERFRPLHDAGVKRVAETPEATRIIGKTVEVVGLRADGAEFPIELSLSTWETAEGRFFGGIIRDIAARKEAEDQARVLETAPDPIVKVDAARRIVLANARTEQLFGYDRSELLGRPVEELFSPHSSRRAGDRFHAACMDPDAGDAPDQGVELAGRRKDGSEFPLDMTLSSVRTADGMVVTSILRDVTERRRFESQLRHLADHDHLTALFNRRRFEEALAEYAAYAARYGRRGAVLLLDLDRFKYINDFYGHSAGDEVVRVVGRALTRVIADTDVVARLGGDEFAVLLKETSREGAQATAEALLTAVRAQEFTIGPASVSLSASIGVVPFGDAEAHAEDLLAVADMAMYAAKEAGGDRLHVSGADDERVAGMQARLAWADQIRRALDEQRFALYWQPIIELATGAATHHELLLRMIGTDGEVISPAAFIETAEQFNLIQELDRWVVRTAIHHLAGDRDAGYRLEINLSGKSIGDPRLPELIEREIAATGVDPARLVFEITETAAIANMDHARAFAERLRNLGCRFALDDFGAGFSSFYYLKHLPLDYVKIDGDFIRNLTGSLTDQLVVKSMVDIARGMGMKTIAEFVENAETVEMLREKGVDYSQGYHHGRPEPMRRLAVARAA